MEVRLKKKGKAECRKEKTFAAPAEVLVRGPVDVREDAGSERTDPSEVPRIRQSVSVLLDGDGEVSRLLAAAVHVPVVFWQHVHVVKYQAVRLHRPS